jgi:hypothetical protein
MPSNTSSSSASTAVDDDADLADRMIRRDQLLVLNVVNIANCGSGSPRIPTVFSDPRRNASTLSDFLHLLVSASTSSRGTAHRLNDTAHRDERADIHVTALQTQTDTSPNSRAGETMRPMMTNTDRRDAFAPAQEWSVDLEYARANASTAERMIRGLTVDPAPRCSPARRTVGFTHSLKCLPV